MGVIIGASVGAAVVIGVIVGVLCYRKHRKSDDIIVSKVESSNELEKDRATTGSNFTDSLRNSESRMV
jgi:hypothetical protein